MSRILHREGGFTLIELMIVILIIAILVAIAIPVYLATRTNAQRRTCQANLRTIDGAINTYLSDYEQYPSTLAQLGGYLKTPFPSCPKGPTGYGWKAGTPPEASCVATGVTGHTYP